MSRALTILGVTLLFSTAGCLYPHSRYTHHRTHGSIYVGGGHHAPPAQVHHHGHGCGHVKVGLEWVVTVPTTRHGSVTPAPTSGRHDRGLHRGHDVAPPHREQSQGAAVGGVVGVLYETAPVGEVVPVLEVVPAPVLVYEYDGHPGRGKGHEKAKGRDDHDKAKGKSLEKAKGKGHEKAKGKGHEKAKGKGHDKHDD